MRWLLVLLFAATLLACKGGKESEDAAGDPEADEVDESDTPADTGTDTRPDPVDTSWDREDVEDDEIVSVCGNLEVEPGEECDPPTSTTTCSTTCGSWGTGTCTDECSAPPPEECAPPDETCNLADDDCDGLVDEGTLSGWTSTVTLSTDGDPSPTVDLAWIGDAYAAVWVVESVPDAIHLAVLGPLGAILLPDTVLGLTPGDVNGRPALSWTGSDLLLAWNTFSDERHVAAADLSATLIAHNSYTSTGLSFAPDLSWSGSHAALVWIEQVSSSYEVFIAFVGPDASQEGTPVQLTSSAVAAEPTVDAATSAVAAAWVDTRTGTAEARRAVVDHDGAIIASDAALTTTGGVSHAAISAGHHLGAWTEFRAGANRIYTLPLDGSWDPVGTETEATDCDDPWFTLASTTGRIGLAWDAGLLTLEPDGVAAGTPVPLGLTTSYALAWGDLNAAAAGRSWGLGLVLAFSGCAGHDTCTSWMPLLESTHTRTAWDPYVHTLGHEAAITGSFSSRPVTYLSVQIYQDAPYHGPDSTGTSILTDDPYETCGLCVLVYEDCGTSSCTRTYLARSGTLDITSIGTTGDTLAGTLSNAQLAEVTIDSTTRESEWVEDGLEICLGTYMFDETID